MKNFLLLLFIAFSLIPKAQTPLPYYTGFDDPQEQAGWTEYRTGEASIYQWEYTGAAYTAPLSLTHGYPVGGSQPTIDWFVSPEFDFSNGATIDSVRYAFSGFGVPNAGDTIAIYLLTGSPDPALATSKIMLKDYRDTNYINDNTWRVDTGIVIPPTAGESYIAFMYTTTVNWLDVKFDNLSVSANIGAGVIEVHANINIYPNPVSDFITIENPANELMRIELFDVTGRLIEQKEILKRGEVGVRHIEKGMVFLKISVEKEIFFKKLIVQ